MNSILSETKLKKLPRPVRKEPIITPKIMHFGPGAFFRSFVANLIDDVNQRDAEKWGIIAVSLNSEATFNNLAGQNLVFNALSMSKTKKRAQKLSSISDFFVAKKDRQAVLEALSDEQIEIVSLTITEKGYYYNAEKKELEALKKQLKKLQKENKKQKESLAILSDTNTTLRSGRTISRS